MGSDSIDLTTPPLNAVSILSTLTAIIQYQGVSQLDLYPINLQII